jgi:VCBS repeat-containing protein
MQSGLNPTFGYANATITNIFVNYTVQGRFKFPAGAFGGGLAGRLNPTTGTHYAAWVYPENSIGGSNVLRLLKFQNYTSFAYQGTAFNPVAQTNLAAVGTGFHTVRMDFSTNRVIVYLDGIAQLNVQDAEATYYTNGAVGLDMWTDSAAYNLVVDDVVANGLGLSANNDPGITTAATGVSKSVPAPGVLANDTGGNAPLSAVLVAATTHGTLSLSNNGGFTYIATNGFAGTDTFTYRVTDGTTTSGTATVTITVTPDNAPVANNDSYGVLVNSSLNVPAPGVLANDTDVDGNSLTAILASGPANGTLTFSNNGSFIYVPNSGFLGVDTFTYRANDGQSNSLPATASISVQPPALFSDNFTRGTDPGPLDPWLVQSGNWTVTGGVMKGGTNALTTYGFAFITNSYNNYSVQARVQFQAPAFGGGIGGRLNPATGGHYAAWIYPENSTGGSNVLRLIKFQSYSSFSYLGVPGPIAEVNLPAVGTGFHTVKLAFLWNRIAVYFDGTLMISALDQEATPYLSGSPILDMWTDNTGYQMSVDDVFVNPLAVDDNYTAAAGSTLSVSAATGVLLNDTEMFGSNLTASVVNPTVHGSLTLTNNGGFTYTPNNGFSGVDSFTYQANDGTTNIGTATANITVIIVNNPPTFTSTPPNRTINELTSLSVTNPATDSDLPPQAITYQLLSPPAGATIDSNAVITWTPSEAQGPGTYTIRTVATDNGGPPKSATNSFTVTVNEVNLPPVLPAQADRTINELTLMTVSDTASDPDLPLNTLTYSFLSAPTGAAISAAGVITWTPTEAQGPSTNTFTIRVVDNGTPPLSDTNTFNVTVLEVNSAPVLPVQANRTIAAQTPLTVVNTATDSDIPTNNLTYQLLTAPSGALISANGVITWTPASEQDNSTNLFRTSVTDDGIPALSTTNLFTVFVNSNAVVVLDSTALVLEGCTPTNNAIDPGETVTMTFAFKNLGTGPTTNLVVTLLETNGVAFPSAPQTYGVLPVGGAIVSQPFTFSAAGTCGGSITPTLRLQDAGSSLGTTNLNFPLGAYSVVLTQNFDSVTAPALPVGWTTSSSGVEVNWRTTNSLADTPPNAAFSPDVGNIGINELVSPQVTLALAPMQLIFRHRYDLETSVTNTIGYDGGVLEIKIGTNDFVDITNAGGTFVTGGYTKVIAGQFSSPIANRGAWSGTINNYTNTVVNLPVAAAGQTIQLRWRCATDDGGPPGGGWRIDSIGIAGTVCCQNTAPILGALPDQTIQELTTLIVTNTATDSSTPPSGLTYTLLNPPAGCVIDTNGIITWTPTEAQGPSTNVITTGATDNGSPPLSATNSFTVTILDVNSPPVLPVQVDLTINEQTTLLVTNTATDSDIPANTLSYVLLSAPAAATIDANGIITWPTTEADGPGVYTITTVVTDNGVPPLSATNSFSVTVNEVNSSPSLSVPPNQTINELTTLSISASATDPDIPANILTFSVVLPPAGMSINPASGAISWTPTEAEGPSVNTITVVVTDNGSPPLSATNTFRVTVNEVNSAPLLTVPPNQTIDELATLSVSASATDSDIPANALTFSLISHPPGMSIEPTSGAITWTPTEAQGPSTNTITVVVTDDGSPPLSATNSFIVVVREVNSAPVLPTQPNMTIAELTLLVVTNTATDSDIPTNSLSYRLVDPPLGALISSSGVITWIPTPLQAPSTNIFETVVTDDGLAPLSATNFFTVFVTTSEVTPAPTIESIVVTNGAATISWTSVIGHTYRLLYTGDLDANWVPIPPDILATSSSTTATDSTESDSVTIRFYRVQLVR